MGVKWTLRCAIVFLEVLEKRSDLADKKFQFPLYKVQPFRDELSAALGLVTLSDVKEDKKRWKELRYFVNWWQSARRFDLMNFVCCVKGPNTDKEFQLSPGGNYYKTLRTWSTYSSFECDTITNIYRNLRMDVF